MSETKRLLIIEDNPGDVGIICELLRDVNQSPGKIRFEMVSAETLGEALQLLKTYSIDVVLSDLNLPDSNGLETLRAVTNAVPEVPVIILTGSVDERWSTEALHAGAQDYLIKGQIDAYSFDRAVRYAIERKRAERDRGQLLLEQAARVAAEHRADLMRRIQYVTDATLANLSSERLIPELLERLRSILVADISTLLFVEGDQTLMPAGSIGLNEESPPNIRIPLGEGFAGKIARKRTAVAVNDPEEVDIRYPGARERGLHSALGAPLIAEGKLIGVVELGTLQPRRFTAEEEQVLLMVADRIAHAIEHVRMYKAEQRARLEAEEANRAKDRFLAVISHELRTPLTPIMGWTSLLRDKTTQISPKAALGVIDRNARLLARLIDDLLNLSASEFGTLQLQKDNVDLNSLLSEAVEAVAHSLRQKRLEFSVELASAPISIHADRERLMQALGNVLNNAAKFTPAGGKIRVMVSDQRQGALVQVRDSGIGISAEFLPHIFDPFRQADASSTREHGGLGLGLSIAHQIVRAHGGTIRAESAGLNAGSTITIEFPRLHHS